MELNISHNDFLKTLKLIYIILQLFTQITNYRAEIQMDSNAAWESMFGRVYTSQRRVVSV